MRSFMTCAFLLAGALTTGVLAAGCAATGGQGGHAAAAGHVAGRLVMEGGALQPGGKQPGERPISGTVTFTAAGRRPVSAVVGSSGTFSVPLPPGRYHVSARSPAIVMVDDDGHSHEESCTRPASATVTAGHTITITLACIVP
jgi:hypothetical protein